MSFTGVKSDEGLPLTGEEKVAAEESYDIPRGKCIRVEELTRRGIPEYKKVWSFLKTPRNLDYKSINERREIPESLQKSNSESGDDLDSSRHETTDPDSCLSPRSKDNSQPGDELSVIREIDYINSNMYSTTEEGRICDGLAARREVDQPNSDSCVSPSAEDGQNCDELDVKREAGAMDSDHCFRAPAENNDPQSWDVPPDVKSEVDQVDEEPNACLSARTKDGRIFEHLEQSTESCDSKTSICTTCPTEKELIGKPSAEACTDLTSQNCKRLRRSIKRKRDVEDSCPICGLTVRYSDLTTHFVKEVENLSKIPHSMRSTRKIRFGEKGVNDTFVQVKCNRENRLSAKVAKYTKKPVNEVYCPVCSLKLTGSEDEINDHVLNCAEEGFESDLNITGFDDSFEEYEFGNETRVRAISFVPGGHRALQGHSSNSKPADADEDLNVDIDDTLKYGKPQYTELDVIHNLTDATEVKQLEQLRKAVVTDPTIGPTVLEFRKWSNVSEEEHVESGKTGSRENIRESNAGNKGVENRDNSNSIENTEESNIVNKGECTKDDNLEIETQSEIVSSLKEKIKSLEEQNKSVKCLICLEPYTKPVVSTTCWHVHCEECWLMTMGVKKLCPQCNLIVFPSDLRRIYL